MATPQPQVGTRQEDAAQLLRVARQGPLWLVADARRASHIDHRPMIRLILTSAAALFLVSCTAKTENPSGTVNTPAAPAAATTDTSAKFELGKNV
jgi:hypothetical protein